MSLEFVNRICPNCKNPNYMVSLGDFAKVYKYKCMNCNGYFNDIDFEKEPLEECVSDCFEPWDVLWKAPDGTFKGRCDNCGFVHVFIEGHATQYKFCPQCGEQKQEL